MDAVCHISSAAVFQINTRQHLLFLGGQTLQSLSHSVCNHIQLGFFKRRPAGSSQHISPCYARRIGIVQRKTFLRRPPHAENQAFCRGYGARQIR